MGCDYTVEWLTKIQKFPCPKERLWMLPKLTHVALLHSSDDETSKAKLVEGRSDGRLARRQKRVEKMRAKEAVLREQLHARKELVKVLC